MVEMTKYAFFRDFGNSDSLLNPIPYIIPRRELSDPTWDHIVDIAVAHFHRLSLEDQQGEAACATSVP